MPGTVFSFCAVTLAEMPWDFVFILAVLGIVVPWRGASRMRVLLQRPLLTRSDRLSLYASTIFFQWLIVGIVAWRAFARQLTPDDLGLAWGEPVHTAIYAAGLTILIAANQMVSLRRLATLPESARGAIYRITERIAPRTRTESGMYVLLACTAGISEEFLYRGFVFAVFARLFFTSGFGEVSGAVLSALWFALAHLYQGKRGLVTTFVVGLIFAMVTILVGSLIPVIVAHTGLDLVVGLYFPLATGDKAGARLEL
jgi:membrane protease YdiL (CAAX protease family)